MTMIKTADFLTIDGDSHVGMPLDLWDTYLDDEIKKRPDRPRHVAREDGIEAFHCGRFQFPPKFVEQGFAMPPSGRPPGPIGGIDPHVRVREFADAEGVDRSVLMPARNLAPSYLADNELGNAMVEAYNNWLHDHCSAYPTRLFGYGILNAADPAHAIREMKRCVTELGMPAVFLNPNVIGATPSDYRTLASEHYYPIYEAAQAMGVPVAFHCFCDPLIEGFDRNWPGYGTIPLWSDINGFPQQGMNIFLNLIAAGVCETFPDLKIGIFESGVGWVPLLIDRLHERVEKFGAMVADSAPKMKLEAIEYIQRQIWFGFEPEDAFVPDFIRWTKAPDRLIFAADYPHLDYEPGQLAEYLAENPLDADIKRMTLRDNSLDYFRWDETACPTITGEARAPDLVAA